MNRKAFIVAAQGLALTAALAHAASSDDAAENSPLSLLKPGVTEAISAELKEALIRRIAVLERTTQAAPGKKEAWTELKTALMRLGVGDFSAGQFDEAKNAFEKAVAIQPGDFQASQSLAACFLKVGKPSDALAVIDRALKANPKSERAWMFRGALLIPERRFSDAEDALEKARMISPASKDVLGSIGFLYLMEGKFAGAVEQLDLALKIDPSDAQLWNNRGVALGGMGDIPGAIESRLHALQIDPENLNGRREVMALLFLAGRWEEGRKEAKEVIAREPANKKAWAGLALSDMKAGRWNEGVDEMIKARSFGQNDVSSALSLCEGFAALGRFDDAEKILAEVLSSEPNNANVLAHIGMIRRSEHRAEEGIRYSEKALEIDPQNPTALGNRISDCMDAGLPKETIGYAKRLLAIPIAASDSRVWAAWLAIGLAEEKLANASEAVAAYRKATELAPDQIAGWEGVARLSNDYVESCNAARKSVELAPDDEAAQATLGSAQARLGRTREAIASLEAVLAKFPGNRFAAQGLRELRSFQNAPLTAALAPFLDLKKESGWQLTRSITDHSGETTNTYMTPASLSNWMFLVNDCRDVDRSPEVEDVRRKAAEAEPGNASLRSNLGLTLLAIASDRHSMRQSLEAEVEFRKAIDLDPTNAETPLRLALALFAQNRFSEAGAICKKAAERDPGSTTAWLYLGQSKAGLGRNSEAVKDYEHSIRLAPAESMAWTEMIESYGRANTNPEGETKIKQLLIDFPKSSAGWTALGRITANQQRYSDAAEAFQKAIALGDSCPDAWDGLGAVHQLQGKHADAEKEILRATKESPQNLQAWGNLASVYLSENKIPEATDASRRALKIAPKNIQALANLAQCLAKTGDKEGASEACDELEEVAPEIARTLRNMLLK